MQKEKLFSARKSKGYTQQQIADILSTDLSNYNRKENGNVKIVKEEWEKIAKFLDVPLEEIYEEDDVKVFINYDNSTLSENSGNYNSNNYNIPDSIIENLQDYITMLKAENKILKDKLEDLESKLSNL